MLVGLRMVVSSGPLGERYFMALHCKAVCSRGGDSNSSGNSLPRALEHHANGSRRSTNSEQQLHFTASILLRLRQLASQQQPSSTSSGTTAVAKD